MSDFGTHIARCHTCRPHFNRDLRGDVPCGFDRISVIVHARAGWCPIGRMQTAVQPADLVIPPPGPHWHLRSELWGEMEGWTTVTREKVDAICHRLPCGECRDHLKQFVAANPLPDDDGPRWVRRLHNAINKIRGLDPWPEL